MCFFKKTKAKIDQLQYTVEQLQKSIETNELERLRQNNKEYSDTLANLSQIKLKVRSAKYSEEDRTVVITYDAPTLVINIDDNGKPELNKTFRAINMLNLINTEDFNTLKKIFEKIKPLS